MHVLCMRSCCAYGLTTSINTLYTICSTWCKTSYFLLLQFFTSAGCALFER
jgi:hypothetical protein